MLFIKYFFKKLSKQSLIKTLRLRDIGARAAQLSARTNPTSDLSSISLTRMQRNLPIFKNYLKRKTKK